MKITANGITMSYALDGAAGAPVVTLSHSLATDLSMWDPQVAPFAARYRVLRYDTRGHGGTDAPSGPYSLAQLADDARALLAALGIVRTHWIGLSMGGMIGQALALRAPEALHSVALCDTTSRIPADATPLWEERIQIALTQGMEPHVEPTIARWFTPRFRETHPDVVDRVRAMIRRTPPIGYAGCCDAIKALDLTDQLGAIALPALVVVGADDPGTPVAASETIHARIAGSRLEILPSAAHLSNIEQAEAFTRVVMEFIGALA